MFLDRVQPHGAVWESYSEKVSDAKKIWPEVTRRIKNERVNEEVS